MRAQHGCNMPHWALPAAAVRGLLATGLCNTHQVSSAPGLGAAGVTGRDAADSLGGQVVDLDGGVLHSEEAGAFNAAAECWRLVDNGGGVYIYGGAR